MNNVFVANDDDVVDDEFLSGGRRMPRFKQAKHPLCNQEHKLCTPLLRVARLNKYFAMLGGFFIYVAISLPWYYGK